MIESLRTTQIAFFRFATPCGNSGGAETRYKKYPCKYPCKETMFSQMVSETICENIVSRYQILVSSLPRVVVFRRRRPKAHFMTGLQHRQPSNKGPSFSLGTLPPQRNTHRFQDTYNVGCYRLIYFSGNIATLLARGIIISLGKNKLLDI